MNSSLLVRMQQLIDSTRAEGLPFVSRTVGELRQKVPDFEGKQFAKDEQPSEDHVRPAAESPC